MISLDITDDEKYLVIRSCNQLEINQIRVSLTKELPNAFIIKKSSPWIPTTRSFINEYGMIPIGCWLIFLNICKEYNFAVELSDALKKYLNSFNLDFNQFKAYVDDLFEGAEDKDGNAFKPYDYQVEAAYNLLKYRNCCSEISTSGGKTLISFIMFKYLHDVVGMDNFLYIVPSVDLATQSAEKYEEYESNLIKHNKSWNTGILKGGISSKEKENAEKCTILFGTFQSLCKKDSSFFSRFTVHIGDECHHFASSNSLKNILNKCTNLKYSFGVTGTFPKDGSYSSFMLQSLLGPLVHVFSAHQLIHKEKKGTPIYIIFQIMDYADIEHKQLLYSMRMNMDPNNPKAGAKNLKEEEKYITSSYSRKKYISELAIKTTQNTLIIFADIQGGYGKDIYTYINHNSDKNVYYIDGNTPNENREYYKNQMKNDDTGNTIIVASKGVFAEGIDIPNIYNIFLIETSKSNRIVRQICGRGIRTSKGKDKVIIFDFVDDLRYSTSGKKKDNYTWKHYKERKKIYQEQGFPTYEQKVEFK